MRLYGAFGTRIDLTMLDVLERLVVGEDLEEADLVRKARVRFAPDGEWQAVYPTPNMEAQRSWSSATDSPAVANVFDGAQALIPTLANLVTALSDLDEPFAVSACGVDRVYLACRGLPLYLLNHQGQLYWSDNEDALAAFCALGQWPARIRDGWVVDLLSGESASLWRTLDAVE